MLVRLRFGAKMIVAADDLSVTPSLVCDGVYDGPFTAYVQRELSAGQVALDVGANAGVFALLMAWQVGPTGAVVAYEPEPRNVGLLRENLALNYVDGWVELRDAAVGAEPGTARLHRSVNFTAYHSLLPFSAAHLAAHEDIDTLDEVEVRVEPLDDLIGRYERIELVKVDVEGFEAEVLRGAAQLIAAGVVRRFSLEINRPRAGAVWEPLVAELRALAAAGWTFARIAEDGTPGTTELQPVLDEGRAAQLLVERF